MAHMVIMISPAAKAESSDVHHDDTLATQRNLHDLHSSVCFKERKTAKETEAWEKERYATVKQQVRRNIVW